MPTQTPAGLVFRKPRRLWDWERTLKQGYILFPKLEISSIFCAQPEYADAAAGCVPLLSHSWVSASPATAPCAVPPIQGGRFCCRSERAHSLQGEGLTDRQGTRGKQYSSDEGGPENTTPHRYAQAEGPTQEQAQAESCLPISPAGYASKQYNSAINIPD